MRRKFVLIEQSLRDVGGHYFEYAREILHAAEAAGYEPVLATHRDFSGADRLPSRWRVLPLFPFTSDRIHRIPSAFSFGLWQQIMASGGNLPAIASRVADAVSDRCKAAVSRLRWWRRLSRVRGFAIACEQLFEQCPLAAGDQVLCSTVSDMDLLGLVRYLRNHPDSAEATWHLQFHFSVYCGRDPDYPAQDRRTSALRWRLADAIASLPRHRLFFYTTTDELGRQFNRLDVARFETLPWPVGEKFRAIDGPRSAPAAAPLRVLCAGAVRREKGSDRLGSLAQSLWDDLLKPRKVQLLFQIGQKRRWQALTELPAGTFESATNIEKLPDAPLVALPHPLQPDEYARLIQSADIGLLLYNADVYFARCSGILAELLAAGVPVIVPAGGWLAEQFAEENYRHLDELAARASYNQSIPSPQAILCVPPGSSDVVIRLRRADSDQPGSYLRIACEQFDAARQSLGRAAEIVGHRGAGLAALVSALFHLAPGCASVHVAVSSAYHKSPPVIERAKAAFLAASATAEGHWPAGRVGRSFADPAEIPRLLAELVSQHAHYHAGAQAFALRWAEQHAAQRTMEEIAFRSASPKLPRTHAA
jgi:glycosyltransferase involved in cell wall biosynthesis